MKIKVIDECMSTGKSTYMLAKMNEWHKEDEHRQIVYLSPMRSEVGDPNDNIEGRVREACPDLDFQLPEARGVNSKTSDLKELLGTTHNIACTHKLFCQLTVAEFKSISETKNILVIDEALETISTYTRASVGDIRELMAKGMLDVNKETGRLSWVGGNDSLRLLCDLKEKCEAGYLYLLGEQVIMWAFPIEVLQAFDEVYVMTYLFKGSIFYYWGSTHNIEFEYLRGIPLVRTTAEVKVATRELITLVDFPAVRGIEKYKYSCTGWTDKTLKNSTAMGKIGDVLSNFIRNRSKGVSKADMLFTCPQNVAERLQKKRGAMYNVDWLESNCKATNDYAHKTCMIYLQDKYINGDYLNYFNSRGVIVDKELYACNSLIQWVFRGCIRKGEPMLVFIPNPRMRNIFKEWLYE